MNKENGCDLILLIEVMFKLNIECFYRIRNYIFDKIKIYKQLIVDIRNNPDRNKIFSIWIIFYTIKNEEAIII